MGKLLKLDFLDSILTVNTTGNESGCIEDQIQTSRFNFQKVGIILWSFLNPNNIISDNSYQPFYTIFSKKSLFYFNN